MKLTTLKNKVKESLVAANDAAIELNNACKIAVEMQRLTSYVGVDSSREELVDFNNATSKVVDLQGKLTEAKCKVLTSSINYDRELRKVIGAAKNYTMLVGIGCAVITFLVAGLV